jgi:hypothetical protein
MFLLWWIFELLHRLVEVTGWGGRKLASLRIKVPTGAGKTSPWVQLGTLLSPEYRREGSWRVLAIGALMGCYLLLLAKAQMMGPLGWDCKRSFDMDKWPARKIWQASEKVGQVEECSPQRKWGLDCSSVAGPARVQGGGSAVYAGEWQWAATDIPLSVIQEKTFLLQQMAQSLPSLLLRWNSSLNPTPSKNSWELIDQLSDSGGDG